MVSQSTLASRVLAIPVQGLRHPGAPTTQALAFSPALALHHLPANALGVALKGADLAPYHRAIFMTFTESPFQAHLDRVTGILVSTI